ncbi:unnamed protein product [Amoebophrya sp. A25]|nr:unnamed protein product [Amoebophrya sp. A25]|eukprot:GSA25T00002987001.1
MSVPADARSVGKRGHNTHQAVCQGALRIARVLTVGAADGEVAGLFAVTRHPPPECSSLVLLLLPLQLLFFTSSPIPLPPYPHLAALLRYFGGHFVFEFFAQNKPERVNFNALFT